MLPRAFKWREGSVGAAGVSPHVRAQSFRQRGGPVAPPPTHTTTQERKDK